MLFGRHLRAALRRVDEPRARARRQAANTAVILATGAASGRPHCVRRPSRVKMHWTTWLGLCSAATGVILTVIDGEILHDLSGTADLLAMGAALSWALCALVLHRLRTVPPRLGRTEVASGWGSSPRALILHGGAHGSALAHRPRRDREPALSLLGRDGRGFGALAPCDPPSSAPRPPTTGTTSPLRRDPHRGFFFEEQIELHRAHGRGPHRLQADFGAARRQRR